MNAQHPIMLLQTYQEHWAEDFNQIKNIISGALSTLNITMEHVGSTSIPGMAAKPIIDIDLIFDKETDFDEIKIRLEKLGYYHNGNQGIEDREVFKRNKQYTGETVLDSMLHHLYVCPKHSSEWQKHLLFRNYLLANEEARIQYRHLKYTIAEAANQNRKAYAQLKEFQAGSFINSIIEKSKRIR